MQRGVSIFDDERSAKSAPSYRSMQLRCSQNLGDQFFGIFGSKLPFGVWPQTSNHLVPAEGFGIKYFPRVIRTMHQLIDVGFSSINPDVEWCPLEWSSRPLLDKYLHSSSFLKLMAVFVSTRIKPPDFISHSKYLRPPLVDPLLGCMETYRTPHLLVVPSGVRCQTRWFGMFWLDQRIFFDACF